MASTEAPAIQVTLRCSDKLDEYDTRTLTLHPGAVIHIGRASKNSAKPELMISPSNAYIDSPTISREHAVLTATSPPAPCVYITDKGSMHGTMVNGNKLEPQKAHRLSDGDVLQFGANVTRENLFYTSRSFTFQSSLPLYPKGFSVPDDVETSDEEDVEINEGLSCAPRYGTQANPVTLDEGSVNNSQKEHVDPADDEAFHDELDLEIQDTTHTLLDVSEDTEDRSPSVDVGKPIYYPENAIDEVSSDENELASKYSSEDDRASHIDDCDSLEDSDESQSDGDMELEDENEEVEEAAVPEHALMPTPFASAIFASKPTPFATPLATSASENHPPSASDPETQAVRDMAMQENKKRLLMTPQDQNSARYAHVAREQYAAGTPMQTDSHDHDSNPELRSAVPIAPFASLGTSPVANIAKGQEPIHFNPIGQNASKTESLRLPGPSESRIDSCAFHNSMFDDMYFAMEATGMPPRPVPARPMQWNNMLDYNPFSPPVNTPVFAAGYHHDIIGPCPAPTEALVPPYADQEPSARSENPWGQPKVPATDFVSGVQTPLRASSPEQTSPPVRRTEVFTIDEIVEKTIEQPPTPTSVTGGVKRKADAMEVAVDEGVEGDVVGGYDKEASLAPGLQAEAAVVARDASTDQAPAMTTSAIEQRPKKKLRSRLGNAAKSAVAWTLPGVFVGAAASVAFLTSVPNDFFVA